MHAHADQCTCLYMCIYLLLRLRLLQLKKLLLILLLGGLDRLLVDKSIVQILDMLQVGKHVPMTVGLGPAEE